VARRRRFHVIRRPHDPPGWTWIVVDRLDSVSAIGCLTRHDARTLARLFGAQDSLPLADATDPASPADPGGHASAADRSDIPRRRRRPAARPGAADRPDAGPDRSTIAAPGRPR